MVHGIGRQVRSDRLFQVLTAVIGVATTNSIPKPLNWEQVTRGAMTHNGKSICRGYQAFVHLHHTSYQ